uniref:Beta-lactamase-related domain-containing protein n=1 Tax=Plectus sambesii TaxID=2011161 RepID=A0A914WG36_9BILA
MLFIVLTTVFCFFAAHISAQWVILEANSSVQLLEHIDEQLVDGRRPVSIEPVVKNGNKDRDIGFLAIYKPQQPDRTWLIRLNMTSERFTAEHSDQAGRGYVIMSVCGYEIDGTARFVAVWEKMPDVSAQDVVIGLTSDEYVIKLREYTDMKLNPHYVCGYNIQGNDFYAGVWHKPVGYLVHWYIAQEDLDECFESDWKYSRENYHPLIFRPFDTKDSVMCTAVWMKDYGNSYRLQIGADVRRMTAELKDSELQPRQVTSFKKDGMKKYLILWTGEQFAWNGRSIAVSQLLPGPSHNFDHIDAVVVNFMRAYEIPAFSFAVSVRERLTLARSYGLADIRKRETVNPESRFRIASVTKPLTSAAIFKLIEMGLLKSLDQKVFGMGNGILGGKFGTKPLNPLLLLVTVRHLLTHRAGGWSNQMKIEFKQPTLERHQFLSWVIDTFQLEYLPGTAYVYSNIGYMFLGRIVEALSNQTYDAFVKRHVFEPSGIIGANIGKRRREQKLPNEVRFIQTDSGGLKSGFFFGILSPT